MVREQSEPAEAPAPQEAEEDESDRKIIRERLAEIGAYPERMLCGKALEEKMKRWGKPVSEVMGKVRTKRKSIPHI